MANSNILKFKDKKGNEYPYLYIDTLSGEFYAVKRIGKEVKKKPLGKEFVKARAQVLNAIQELASEKPIQTGNKIIKDFYEIMLEEKKSVSTKEATLRRMDTIWRNNIAPYWEYLTPSDVDQDQITKFMTWHRRKHPGVQFLNTFKYLGNIFQIMIDRDFLTPAKRPKLAIPKDEQKHHDKEKGRYISDAEVKAILDKADPVTALMIRIYHACGFRKMEVGSIEKSRVVLNGDRYVLKLDTDDTKTGLAREVPLPKEITSLVKAQIESSKSLFLFPMKSDSSRHVYPKAIDDGWIAGKTLGEVKGAMRIHDLRHTAARNFATLGINPIIACTILGMSLATYQKVYCKLKASDLILAVEQSAARLAAK
jgi:integrase